MSEYRPGQSVKVDGETYKVGAAVSGYLCEGPWGGETFLTAGQLDAGKRMVMAGGPLDIATIDVDNMPEGDRIALMAKLKVGTPEFAAVKASAKKKAGLNG